MLGHCAYHPGLEQLKHLTGGIMAQLLSKFKANTDNTIQRTESQFIENNGMI